MFGWLDPRESLCPYYYTILNGEAIWDGSFLNDHVVRGSGSWFGPEGTSHYTAD